MKPLLKSMATAFFFCIVFASCQEDAWEEAQIPSEDITDNQYSDVDENDSPQVSLKELNNVITEQRAGRSRSAFYTIDEYKNEQGETVFYIANYSDGGWCIVSASKNLYPIMAYNETGTFKITSDMPPTLEMWLDGASYAVDKSYTFPEDSIAGPRHEWDRYIKKSTKLKSRSYIDDYNEHPYDNIPTEEYVKLKKITNDSIHKWTDRGWKVTQLTQEFLDEDPYIAQFAEGAIYPQYYDAYAEFTYMIEYDVSANYRKRCVQSEWVQDRGFNQAFPMLKYGNDSVRAVVGCGPLAVGQIMRYYKYPNNFDWDNMPLTYPTLTTSKFLYNIAKWCGAKFNVDGNGNPSTSITLDKARFVLQLYGYNTSKIKSLSQSTSGADYYSLSLDAPVLVRGDVNGDNSGHEWIITGSDLIVSSSYKEYYTFTQRYSLNRFEKIEVDNHNIMTIKINWEWYGEWDGSFSPNYLYAPGYKKKLDNMKYITDIKPNNQ